MPFSTTLTFRSDETIVKPVSLMLTFDKINGAPSMDQVAWRVLEFGGPGEFAAVSYTQNFMFASVQLEDGNRVSVAAYTAISTGQQTVLENIPGGVIFTTTTTGNPGEIMATNETGKSQGLAVGFISDAGIPNPLLVWPAIVDDQSVEVEFTPILSIYATSDYQQTQLITDPIVSPLLLKQNLALLPTQKSYTLKMNLDGSYYIIADQKAVPSLKPRAKYDPRFDDYIPGPSNAITVTNRLSSIIQVKVTNATNPNGSELFYQVDPDQKDSWGRNGAELISVNVGGAGRVAEYYGILGKDLQIFAP